MGRRIEDNEQLPELERCLESLTDFYPVIVVNGKWNDFEGKNPRSTPEANELINSYSNVIHVQSPSKPEWYNRNMALRIAENANCDTLFWVDTDEYVEFRIDYDYFINNIDFGDKHTAYVNFWDKGRGGDCHMIRGLTNISEIKLNKQHNAWMVEKKDVFKDPYCQVIKGLTIYSEKGYRSNDRECRMKERNARNPIH